MRCVYMKRTEDELAWPHALALQALDSRWCSGVTEEATAMTELLSGSMNVEICTQTF